MALSDFQRTSSDWRKQIKQNERKTRIVIVLFVFIYMMVGLLVDVVILHSIYPQLPIESAVYLLLGFKVWPYATLIMIAIAALSLLITYAMYDRIMLLGTDYYQITPESARNLREKQLYNVVEEMKVAAGMQFMPKIYLIRADYMNAFASGYSEKSAMVAITQGLFDKLDRAELQAVMAHELSHIRHLDIKLTLMVAVLSNIILIVLDVLFYSFLFKKNDRNGDNRLMLVVIVLRYVLPLLTVILALFLSRTREYMADAGSVELMRDNEPMARALLKISEDHETHSTEYAKEYGETAHEQIRRASYLYDPSSIDPVKSLDSMFSTHPKTEQRLEAMRFKRRR